MRRFLDGLYFWSGIAAAASIFAIFALVALQVSARIADSAMRIAGLTPLGFIVPSIAEICGYLLAAASFLALAQTLVKGGHIRVGMLVENLRPGVRRVVEGLVGLAALSISLTMTVALARLTLKSLAFNDVSYGIIPVPLALPQGLMTLGLAILSIAILDVTLRAFRTGFVLPGGREA